LIVGIVVVSSRRYSEILIYIDSGYSGCIFSEILGDTDIY
jgi:hypothetical protein